MVYGKEWARVTLLIPPSLPPSLPPAGKIFRGGLFKLLFVFLMPAFYSLHTHPSLPPSFPPSLPPSSRQNLPWRPPQAPVRFPYARLLLPPSPGRATQEAQQLGGSQPRLSTHF